VKEENKWLGARRDAAREGKQVIKNN